MKWRTTILILIVFGLDCLTDNWHLIFRNEPAETWEQWGYQMVDYLKDRSYFDFIPYLLIPVTSLKWFRMDIFDWILLSVCLFSCVITTIDYYDNSNTREINIDFIIYGVFIPLTLIFKWTRLRKHT